MRERVSDSGIFEILGRFLLDIFFPNRCALCGDFIVWNEYICKSCGENVPAANGVICRKCGKLRCECRRKHKPDYDMAFAAFFFREGPVRNGIYRFKHTGESNIAEYTARDIDLYMKKENVPKPDIIVPVPMGRKKRFKRGHNQAEILAKCIGKRLHIPVKNKILFKCDSQEEQHNLSRKERLERVEKQFYSKKADLTGMTVLLCDDVMTSGATNNKCARLLKELGAEKVISAVCAVREFESTIKEGA